MNLRARIGQGAMSLASLSGLRPAARTPIGKTQEIISESLMVDGRRVTAAVDQREDAPTSQEIARREANDEALRVATLNDVSAPVAEADPPGGENGEDDQESDPMDDLRRRVEELESRMPAEESATANEEAAAWSARINAIFAEPAASAHAALAIRLAFGSDMDAAAVIAELRAAAKAATGLDARMANAPSAALPPAQPTATPKEAVASSWDNAFAAIRRR